MSETINRIKYFFSKVYSDKPFWVCSVYYRPKYVDRLLFKIWRIEVRYSYKAYHASFFVNISRKFEYAIRGTKLSHIIYQLKQTKEKRRRKKRAKLLSYKSVNFIPFFDYSSGEMIDMPEKLKDRQREGFMAISYDEMKRESRKIKREKEQKHKKRIRKDLENAYRDIKKGRSFINELMPKVEQKTIDAFNKAQK